MRLYPSTDREMGQHVVFQKLAADRESRYRLRRGGPGRQEKRHISTPQREGCAESLGFNWLETQPDCQKKGRSTYPRRTPARNFAGFIALLCHQSSKWRCGPVDRPVLPTYPITSLRETRWPGWTL